MPTFKTQHQSGLTMLQLALREAGAMLIAKREFEMGVNNHNFQSGAPLEAAVRSTLARLLPTNYRVGAGEVLDGEGYTSGDVDVIVYSDRVTPPLRLPAAPGSRRRFFAADATYGIVEVKQSLTLGLLNDDGTHAQAASGSLWEAAKKIAAFKELKRTGPTLGQVVENSPPPFGYVVALGADEEVLEPERLAAEMKAMCDRIPKELRPDGVFVLGRTSVIWARADSRQQRELQARMQAAAATDDLELEARLQTELQDLPAIEVRWADHARGFSVCATGADTFYRFFLSLWTYAGEMRLGTPNLWDDFGGSAVRRLQSENYLGEEHVAYLGGEAEDEE